MEVWRRPLVRAALIAVVVFVLASVIESLIIQRVAHDIAALEFISDTILACALGGATFLWLRLRATAGGPPLGLLPNPAYEQGSLLLPPGAIGTFVTDGITERLPGGMDALVGILRELMQVPQPPEAICAAVQDVAGKSGGPAGVEGWQDDRTVVAFVHRLAHA